MIITDDWHLSREYLFSLDFFDLFSRIRLGVYRMRARVPLLDTQNCKSSKATTQIYAVAVAVFAIGERSSYQLQERLQSAGIFWMSAMTYNILMRSPKSIYSTLDRLKNFNVF